MSLSPQEESALRRMIRDSTPMRPVNAGTSDQPDAQMSYGQYLGRLVDAEIAKGPMRVVAGPDSEGEFLRPRAPKEQPREAETVTYRKDTPTFT